MNELQTLAFWADRLLAVTENHMEMCKDDPETFDMPDEWVDQNGKLVITLSWALGALNDHLDCTDEMWSAHENYELIYGKIDRDEFNESYATFVSAFKGGEQ